MLTTIQIGLNTADQPGSLRLYSEAFGLANAGGQGIWGSTVMIQGLPPESRAMMWWLVGRQPFFQFEFFHHTAPAQRPLRADWRPSDHGWVRFGIAVTDFDATLAALDRHGVALLAPVAERDGLRRVSFRDPHVGVIVEVMEEGAALIGHALRPSGEGGALVYAAASVSDLAGAEAFYRDALRFPIVPLEGLHTPGDEASWGLSGAEREGFLARAGGVHLEIVRYADPVGRPRPADYRCSDQGMVNVAFGSYEPADVAEVLDRLAEQGLTPPHIVRMEGVLAGYITAPEREVELTAIPEAALPALGFVSVGSFLT